MSRSYVTHPATTIAVSTTLAASVVTLEPSLGTELLADSLGAIRTLAVLALVALAGVTTFDARRRLSGQGRPPADALIAAPAAALAANALAFALARIGSAIAPPLVALVAAALASAVLYGRCYEAWTRLPAALLPVARAREVWWATIPYSEGSGSKDRPCVVLSTSGRRVAVLMCTSKDKSGQQGYTQMPPHIWGARGKASWIKTDRRITIDREDLRRLQGRLGQHEWTDLRLPTR